MSSAGANTIAQAVIDIIVNDAQARQQIANLRPQLQQATAGVTTLTGAWAALQRLVVGGGVALGVRHAVLEFANAERQMTLVNSVIKATGSAAGLSAVDIANMATEMQRLTQYEDEAAMGAARVLLTFRSIKGDNFRAALTAAADMATVMESDLMSAALQVGKALQDPILGLTALRRAGVSFSAEQKELIKDLLAVGDAAGAQRVILEKLKNEFGGAAEAAGNTFSGSVSKLTNSLGDLAETLGGMVAPSLQVVIDLLRDMANELNDLLNGGGGGATGSVLANPGKALQSGFFSMVKQLGNILPMSEENRQKFMAEADAEIRKIWDDVPEVEAHGRQITDETRAAAEKANRDGGGFSGRRGRTPKEYKEASKKAHDAFRFRTGLDLSKDEAGMMAAAMATGGGFGGLLGTGSLSDVLTREERHKQGERRRKFQQDAMEAGLGGGGKDDMRKASFGSLADFHKQMQLSISEKDNAAKQTAEATKGTKEAIDRMQAEGIKIRNFEDAQFAATVA